MIVTTATRYREESAITCTNLYAGQTHIGQVWYFTGVVPGHPERTQRWFWDSPCRDLPMACFADGYTTYADARQSLIDAWEGRS
jgi:hypothetical protein